MKIHEKIKIYSEKHKETAAGLGREYGASQQTVSNYLLGKNAMPLEFLSFYIEKHPEIDLYRLFDVKDVSKSVAEERSDYDFKAKKKNVIDKIVAVLEAEL